MTIKKKTVKKEPVPPPPLDVKQYMGALADQFVHELQPIAAIKELTSNSILLGQYAEAAIMRLVRRCVAPMRVSTGSVLDFPLPPMLRQVDAIIWAPYPAPALFDVEDFALVPKSSAFGVMEIKRTCYSEVVNELTAFLSAVDARTIVSDPAVTIADYNLLPGLGVVCLLDKKPPKKLQAMIEQEKAVAVFSMIDSKLKVRPRDVLVLINFLYRVTWRHSLTRLKLSPIQLDLSAL
jgi:hypothetical protein